MSQDDERTAARRRLLVEGAAAAVGAVAGSGARAEEMRPPGIPEWIKVPGADTRSQPYATSSRFEARCASCHGSRGEGGTGEQLAGGSGPLASAKPVATVGSF